MAIYSRSSIQRTNNRRFRIWKNKCIIKCNKQSTGYPYEIKYQRLINKRESAGLKHFNDPKTFIKYLNDIQDVYKNVDEYNVNKERNWYD